MTDKIVSINKKKGKEDDTTPPQPPVDSDVVQALEELLQNAKLGYITEVVGVVQWLSGEMGVVDVGISQSPLKTFGALTHCSLEYRDWYLVQYDEQ